MKRVLTIVCNALHLQSNLAVGAVAGLAFTLLATLAEASSVISDVTGEDAVKADDVRVGQTYEMALYRLNNAIKANRQRIEKNPESWLNREWLANAYLERAKLTGQFSHYAQADAAMKQAARLSNSPLNMALSRAALNYTLHRLLEVEIDLQQAEKALLLDAPTQRRIAALRADVALQQGRYEVALVAYKSLNEQAPSTESAFRLANYYWQVNDEALFEQWMQTASARVMGQAPRVHAWLNLQLGIADLSRGRYDDALVHYNDGLALFPGYWLLEEHIAEIDVIQGRLLLAETKYRDLIKRTDSPMFRIALAEVLQMINTDSKSVEAMQLTQAAKDQLVNMMEIIPESMAGHALEVSLQLDDPEKALSLAKHNHVIRPNGSSSVLLAQAYMLVGEVDKAEELLHRVLASPYRSPDLFATASVVSKVNGQLDQAEEFTESAIALKHDAMDDVMWLIR